MLCLSLRSEYTAPQISLVKVGNGNVTSKGMQNDTYDDEYCTEGTSKRCIASSTPNDLIYKGARDWGLERPSADSRGLRAPRSCRRA